MVAEIRTRAQRRDRWVSWIVIAVVVVALVGGWTVKMLTEGRTVPYDEGGIRVRYPAGWVRAEVEPPVLFQVEDRLAAPFRTTLTLQRRPLPADVDRPLGMLQQTLTIERSRSWTAYRVLQTEENASIGGRQAMHVTFAYVETNPNPWLETVPVVMYGEDYLFPGDGEASIVTLTAAEENYERAQRYLQDFVLSWQD